MPDPTDTCAYCHRVPVYNVALRILSCRQHLPDAVEEVGGPHVRVYRLYD